MNENLLLELIVEWMYHNEKLKEINKYLYEHTELFERRYENNYNFDLYDFFAGKITTFTRNYNELTKKLSKEQIKKIRIIELKRR